MRPALLSVIQFGWNAMQIPVGSPRDGIERPHRIHQLGQPHHLAGTLPDQGDTSTSAGGCGSHFPGLVAAEYQANPWLINY
jgi:hypothetical protein